MTASSPSVRWATASGLSFVILFLAAFGFGGDSPAIADPPSAFSEYFATERGALLIGSLLYAASLGAFLWFVTALAGLLRSGGEHLLATTAVAAGSIYVGMGLTADGLSMAFEQWSATEVDAEVAKAFDLLTTGLIFMSWLPLAFTVLAVGLAVIRSGVLAPWFGRASIAAAVPIMLLATTWARGGIWSPDGGYPLLALFVLFAWTLTAVALLSRRSSGTTEVLRGAESRRAALR